MTARVQLPPDGICNVQGCGNLAEFKVGAKVRVHDGRPDPLEVETTLEVCSAHRENPPIPAPQFFQPHMRANLNGLLVAGGQTAADFDTAEWCYAPLTKPAHEVAN